jgi:hypothetical protein
MNGRPTILEIATTKYETDKELLTTAMDSLQAQCGIKEGFLVSEAMERFGWAFFKILIKTEFLSAIQITLGDKITSSKGKKAEEKFVNFMKNYFESKDAIVKVKLTEA